MGIGGLTSGTKTSKTMQTICVPVMSGKTWPSAYVKRATPVALLLSSLCAPVSIRSIRACGPRNGGAHALVDEQRHEERRGGHEEHRSGADAEQLYAKRAGGLQEQQRGEECALVRRVNEELRGKRACGARSLSAWRRG
jgi:hypothetical protein